MQEPLILVVQGPTASGKTALAIDFARYFQTEIISFDSRQFYREMSIGTAVPTAEELGAVKHHFIHNESYMNPINAAEFASMAQPVLKEILNKFGAVVLVGGSALFADALLLGLDELPHDPLVQKKWQEVFENKGLEFIQAELLRLDHEFYPKVDLQNARRIIRALEIAEISGKSNNELRTGLRQTPAQLKRFVINWPRELLYQRINKRVEQMFEAGLEQEAQQFFEVFSQYKTLQTVGYTEFFNFWKGELTQEQVPNLIKQHTRNYAKRQLTWMRRYDDVHYLNPLSVQTIFEQAMDQIG